MPFLQEILHKLEVGQGTRYLRLGLIVLVIIVVTAVYNLRGFRNMATQEAMDTAQLGRNIAQGKGYTTLFIRPLSIYLVKTRNQEQGGAPQIGKSVDLAELRGMHPDLANPPVYPVVLAALMKVLPFHYTISTLKSFTFFQPDFLIALFNQLLFLGVVALVFLLARRLFDPGVAWLSAGVLLGTELFWRFSVSGLSTMLLMVIFLGLVWCLVLLEEEVRVPKWGASGILVFAGLTGAMVGVGGLTRYSFAWLIIPVVGFLILYGGKRRIVLSLIAVAAFALVMGPWIVRNYSVSGKPFGTATYAVLETTIFHPESRLERSLEPDFTHTHIMAFWLKLNTNLRQIVTDDLPRLGGSWISAFFLAGLMIAFRSPALTRLRYFLIGCIVVLALVQALGRTQLSGESHEINSENLLVLVAPLVLLYGVSLFFVLLEQIRMPFPEVRFIAVGVFGVMACLPMLFVLLPPKAQTIAYPPYDPQGIQTIEGWLKENELAMSDIPWAVAWYGQRQCVWLTLKCIPAAGDQTAHDDFFAINDYLKPINLLYLTPQTTDGRFYSQWFKAGETSWGNFILETMVLRRVPTNFPLRKSPTRWPTDQLVLADWQRWRM